MPTRIPKILFESVRGRLILLVTAITVAALLLGLLLVIQAYRNERRVVERHLAATARALSAGVDLQLNHYEALLKGLAAFPALQRGELDAFDASARAMLQEEGEWALLMDYSGNQLVNTRVPRGTPLPRSTPVPEMIEALNRNETYFSDVVQCDVIKDPVLYVAIPVKSDGRDLILCLVTLPSVFAEGVAVERLATTGTVAVIDRNGIIAARNRSPELFVGKPATELVRNVIKENTQGVLESITLDSIPVLSAFYRAKSGWTVVGAVPREEIYHSAGKLLTLALALSGVLLAVSLILSQWIGRAVVQGVGTLVKNTAMVGRGEIPPRKPMALAEIDFVANAISETAEQLMTRQRERDKAEEALRDESRILELLNKTGTLIASELDIESLVQVVTDSATELSGAKFGAFFYNHTDENGKSFMLYTLSGAPREAFERFDHPRSTPIFAPTFEGSAIVRLDDVTKDPRYGQMPPHFGMPKGHLPVRSYLAVPVVSRSGEVFGGLFFGHPEPGVFTERSERLVAGVAAQAAIAIDNARLYETSQKEICERKLAQAELQKAKDELEQKVLERTASLRETTEQLETFCYSVAHDLRAPLRAQQSFAQALVEDYGTVLDATGYDYVVRIHKSAMRLDALVTDLLTYSRISRNELQFEKVNLDRVIEEIRTTLADQITSRKAAFCVASPLLPVRAHEPTLNLVMTNLIENALKFVKPGDAPRITVRTEHRDSFVRIWVEDNGIGINEQGLHKIFGVFERLHPVNVYPGTGIGLAIVQKAVERMGGKVGVESEVDKGSRFWIELPVA